MLCFVKAINLVHVRCPDEASIKTVLPAMIRASDCIAQLPAPFDHSRPTVPTDIVKPTNLFFLIAQDDQTFTECFLHKVVARSGDLRLMADAQPLGGKDPRLLLLKNLLRNKVTP